MLVLAGLCAAGAARGDATPTITCSMTITDASGAAVASAPANAALTYTITVTSTDAALLSPGTVNFWTSPSDQLGGDDTALTINGGTGTASITTSSLAEGSHNVFGQWLTSLGGPSCVTPTVPITIGGIGGTTTTTHVTITPSTVDRFSNVTLTATVTQTGHPDAPVGGNVIFSVVTPTVALGNGDKIPLIDNTATLETPIMLPAGTYTIQALYTGDLADQIPGSSDVATIVVRDNSYLTYQGDATVQAGKQATLGGTLLDRDGNAIANQTVTLSVEGTDATCTGMTDATGAISCLAVVDARAGTYRTIADYEGDDFFKPTQGLGAIAVTPGPTTLVYTGAIHAVVGRAATLSATLTTEAGAPIANAPVALSVAGHASMSCTVPTTSAGVASCTLPTTLATGTFEVDADYAGDPLHYTSSQDHSGRLTIVVSVPTVLSYDGPSTTQPAGSTVAPQFTLTDDQGNPVPYVSVTITFGGVSTSVTTDADGVATAPAQTFRLGGTHAVTATFGGAPGFDPTPRPAAGSVRIAAAPTALVVLPTTPVLTGQPVSVSAKLTDSLDGGGIGGQSLTLTFDGVACTGTTGPDGVVSCTTAPIVGPARSVGTAAELAPTDEVEGASATGTGIVFAFAPGGGFYVVGDRSASAGVTFWGAQWWKLNTLAGGSGPGAFKGFAGTVTAPTQCGTTWTTRPGNSTPPPAGPLPAYMGVVVSSSIGKAGAVITGDVKKIVIVQTDGGYAPDPGHAGTGTVVATFCGS